MSFKPVSILLTAVLVFLTTFSVSAESISSDIKININGKRIYPDSAPFIKDGRTLVPIRGVFEHLGASVSWDPSNYEVNVSYNGRNINMYIGNNKAYINGVPTYMDVAPLIYRDRTMIPLRFLAENAGMNVGWIDGARLACITDPSYMAASNGKTILGFTVSDYTGDTLSYKSLLKYGDNITSIAACLYRVDSDGDLIRAGASQEDTVSYANSKGIKPLLLVNNFMNDRFDKRLAHSVLSQPSIRKKLVANILTEVGQQGYSGVNLDLEAVPPYDRDNYTSLVAEMKNAMSQCGFITTVSLPAKTGTIETWYEGYDYAAIGKYADKILLMTYDEHYLGGDPGPVASIDWVKSVVEYASSVVAPDKLLLGLAAYGYDWSDYGNKALTINNINNILASKNVNSVWDDNAMSPMFTYNEDGTRHSVWYENDASLSYKLALVDKNGLGGIGVWRLGFENNSFWNTIKQNIK